MRRWEENMNMQKPAYTVFGVFLGCMIFSGMSLAQEAKRTEIKRADLTGTNMEIIVQLVESPPGTVLAKHFHNGEETSYTLEGGMVQAPGEAPKERLAGSIVINKRGVPHAGYSVVGDKTIKSLNVYVVDKDKPLAVPVQK